MAKGSMKARKEVRKPKKDAKKPTGPAPLSAPAAAVPAFRLKDKTKK
jgi:hypothetical protein